MNKALIKSFLIVFLYVGMGTVALLFLNSSSILVPIGLLLTIPVTFISFGVVYIEGGDSTMLVLIVQMFMFLLTWLIVYGVLSKRLRK